jgi:hypothetical protein
METQRPKSKALCQMLAQLQCAAFVNLANYNAWRLVYSKELNAQFERMPSATNVRAWLRMRFYRDVGLILADGTTTHSEMQEVDPR